ncbi:MAG: NosD domain-containing protein, partial [Candidatus Hodarchaeales archaeon]
MIRKIVAVWASLAMLFGFVVIVDVVTDITPPVKAATITVDDSGGADYFTIQEGIDAANPGDTVFVYNGMYYENININKAINVIGEHISLVRVEGVVSNDVVKISTNGVNLSNFTIRKPGSVGGFSGVKISGSYNNVSNTVIYTNDHYGIYSSWDDNNITNNIIYNNRYGIHLSGDRNNIEYNTIFDNEYGIDLATSQR